MTKLTITTWTCNRCGATEQINPDTRRAPFYPRGWIEVRFGAIRAVAASPTLLGHLCKDCEGFLVSFVNGTLEEDMAKAAAVAESLRKVNAECLWSGVDKLRRGQRRKVLFSTLCFGLDQEELPEEDEDDDG